MGHDYKLQADYLEFHALSDATVDKHFKLENAYSGWCEC